MKRTGEKILIVVGSILNALTMILSLIMIAFTKSVLNDPASVEEFIKTIEEAPQQEGVEPLNVEEVQTAFDTLTPFIGVFGWIVFAFALISLILGIVAFIYVSKKGKEKLSGGLLIGAGLAGGILSLTAILYYVAAILCFVRKEKPAEKHNIEEL